MERWRYQPSRNISKSPFRRPWIPTEVPLCPPFRLPLPVPPPMSSCPGTSAGMEANDASHGNPVDCSSNILCPRYFVFCREGEGGRMTVSAIEVIEKMVNRVIHMTIGSDHRIGTCLTREI